MIRVITTLEELPFSAFIKCAVDSDYSVLSVGDELPTEDELRGAWVKLSGEFHDLMADEQARERWELAAEIETLNTKILHVTAIIAVLRESMLQYELNGVMFQGFDPDELIEGLKVWGYELRGTDLAEWLDKLERWLSSDRLKMGIAKEKYEQYSAENGEHKVATRADYIGNLLALAKHRGVATIRADQINTLEYCMMVKELKEYNEAVSRVYEKREYEHK